MATMKWENIVSDPEYRALPEQQKSKVREGYFRENVLSDPEYRALPQDKQNVVYNNFLNAEKEINPIQQPTQPQQAIQQTVKQVIQPPIQHITPPEQSIGSRYAGMLDVPIPDRQMLSQEVAPKVSPVIQRMATTQLPEQIISTAYGASKGALSIPLIMAGKEATQAAKEIAEQHPAASAVGEVGTTIGTMALMGSLTKGVAPIISKAMTSPKLARFVPRAIQGAITFSANNLLKETGKQLSEGEFDGIKIFDETSKGYLYGLGTGGLGGIAGTAKRIISTGTFAGTMTAFDNLVKQGQVNPIDVLFNTALVSAFTAINAPQVSKKIQQSALQELEKATYNRILKATPDIDRDTAQKAARSFVNAFQVETVRAGGRMPTTGEIDNFTEGIIKGWKIAVETPIGVSSEMVVRPDIIRTLGQELLPAPTQPTGIPTPPITSTPAGLGRLVSPSPTLSLPEQAGITQPRTPQPTLPRATTPEVIELPEVKPKIETEKQEQAGEGITPTEKAPENVLAEPETVLLDEAKKYNTPEEFVSRMQGSSTQYGKHSPEYRMFGIEGYKNLKDLGIYPDKIVTIYRGIDDVSGTIKKKIKSGDFVTTDYETALSYCGVPENVVSKKVKSSNLYTLDADDFIAEPFYLGSEYLYAEKELKPLSTKTLTDIWKQANAKKVEVEPTKDELMRGELAKVEEKYKKEAGKIRSSEGLWNFMKGRVSAKSVKELGYDLKELREFGIPYFFWSKSPEASSLDTFAQENKHLLGIYDDRVNATESFIEALKKIGSGRGGDPLDIATTISEQEQLFSLLHEIETMKDDIRGEYGKGQGTKVIETIQKQVENEVVDRPSDEIIKTIQREAPDEIRELEEHLTDKDIKDIRQALSDNVNVGVFKEALDYYDKHIEPTKTKDVIKVGTEVEVKDIDKPREILDIRDETDLEGNKYTQYLTKEGWIEKHQIEKILQPPTKLEPLFEAGEGKGIEQPKKVVKTPTTEVEVRRDMEAQAKAEREKQYLPDDKEMFKETKAVEKPEAKKVTPDIIGKQFKFKTVFTHGKGKEEFVDEMITVTDIRDGMVSYRSDKAVGSMSVKTFEEDVLNYKEDNIGDIASRNAKEVKERYSSTEQVESGYKKKPLDKDNPYHHDPETALKMVMDKRNKRYYDLFKKVDKVVQDYKDVEQSKEYQAIRGKRYSSLTSEEKALKSKYVGLAEQYKKAQHFYEFWGRKDSSGKTKIDQHFVVNEKTKSEFMPEYIKEVKKAISKGYDISPEIIKRFPELEKAIDARERYEKGHHTSFANVSVAINRVTQEDYGFKVKRQDGKAITNEQIQDITKAAHEFEKVVGPIKDIIEKLDLTIAHTNGKYPFLMNDVSGLYSGHHKTITVGVDKIKSFAHELAHGLDDASGTMTQHSSRTLNKQVRTGSYIIDNVDVASMGRKLMNGSEYEIEKQMKLTGRLTDEQKEAARLLKARIGKYFNRDEEIYARLVEQYVSTKLGGKLVGSKSELAEGENFYHDTPAYWSEENFKEIEPHLKKLVDKKLELARKILGLTEKKHFGSVYEYDDIESLIKPKPSSEFLQVYRYVGDSKRLDVSGMRVIGEGGKQKTISVTPGEEFRLYEVMKDGKKEYHLQDGVKVIVSKGWLNKNIFNKPDDWAKLGEGEIDYPASGGKIHLEKQDEPAGLTPKEVKKQLKGKKPRPKRDIHKTLDIQQRQEPVHSEKEALKVKLRAEREAAKVVATEMKKVTAMYYKGIKPLGKGSIIGFEDRKTLEGLKLQLRKSMDSKEISRLYDEIREFKKEATERQKEALKDRTDRISAIRDMVVDELKSKGKIPATKSVSGEIGQGGKSVVRKITSQTYSYERLTRAVGQGEKGEFYKQMYKIINTAENDKLRNIDKRLNKFQENIESIDFDLKKLAQIEKVDNKELTREEMLGIYGLSLNDKGRLAVMNGNLSDMSPVEADSFIKKVSGMLTDKEKQIAEFIMQDYEENFDRVNKVFISLTDGKKQMGNEKNYTPIRRKSVNYVEGDEGIIPLVAELGADEAEREFWKKYPSKSFTKSRLNIPAEYQTPVSLNIVSGFIKQVEKQEHFIALGEPIRDNQRILNDKAVKGLIKGLYGKDVFNSIQNGVNRIADPSIYKAQNMLDQTMSMLRVNTAISALAFNIVSGLVQVPSVFLYAPEVGGKNLLSAARDYLVNHREIDKLIEEVSPQMKHRSMDTFFNDLERSDPNKYAQIVKQIGEKGMAHISLFDKIAVRTGFWALYNKGLQDGLTEQEAVEFAELVTFRTQSVSAPKDIPSILAHKGFFGGFFRALGQFRTELIQFFGVITNDIPKDYKDGKTDYATRKLIAMILTLWTVQTIKNGGRKPTKREMVDSAVSVTLPVVGDLITSSRNGFRNDVPMLSSFSSMGKGLAELEKEHYGKALENILRGGAGVSGVPFSQPYRTLKGIAELSQGETDDLRRLVWSRYMLGQSKDKKNDSPFKSGSTIKGGSTIRGGSSIRGGSTIR